MERASCSTAVRAAAVVFAVVAIAPLGCDHQDGGHRSAEPHPSAEQSPATQPADTPRAGAGAEAASRAPGDGGPDEASTYGCPDGMVRVEGEYCPAAVEECAKYNSDYIKHHDDKNVSARCLEFRPSRCISDKLEHLAFCMDRYEYPDQVGKMPRVLTSWLEATALCESEGKRLCTEDEFNFACEGPQMFPYVTGYTRDAKACNIDKPYIMPDHEHRMLPYEACKKDERCSAELKRLDQRHAIGAVNTCVSWAGVVDLNGNVNEWVTRKDGKKPRRGGLKGGWWGPVRDRCRPTVIFHKEFDYGYEAGFRCCRDLGAPIGVRDGGSSAAVQPATRDAGASADAGG